MYLCPFREGRTRSGAPPFKETTNVSLYSLRITPKLSGFGAVKISFCPSGETLKDRRNIGPGKIAHCEPD